VRTWRTCLVVWSGLLAGLLALAVGEVRCADGVGEPPSRSELKLQRPWLMVSLCTDGCSSGCRNVYSVITTLSGNRRGKIVHFSEVTPEFITETQPEFVVLGPQGTPWCRYAGPKGVALQNFLWLLPVMAEEMNIPILGICGGHQALALAFGGKVGPIRAGEFDCLPYSRDRQSGVVQLTLMASDPLFQGAVGQVRMTESHYDEVKVLPPGFVLLAYEKMSPNQIIRHHKLPVYGIQGHPERFFSTRPDGGILLRNFLGIARCHNREFRSAQLSAPVLLTSRRSQGTTARKRPH
jgi:GMP synthase (glutamine-hydrolysing)